MTEYLPYIFGISALLGGIYALLYSFKIHKPKLESEEDHAKYEDWHKKFGAPMKILSIVIIFIGFYQIFFSSPDQYKIYPSNSNTNWSEADQVEFVEGCFQSTGETGLIYPNEARIYCECLFNEIKSQLSYQEYIESFQQSDEEQMVFLKPLIEKCKIDFQNNIEASDTVDFGI